MYNISISLNDTHLLTVKYICKESKIGLLITLVLFHDVFLFVGFVTLKTWILIGWSIKLSVQTFQALIEIEKRGNFVYHHWRYTSIYRPFSYPLKLPENIQIFSLFLLFLGHEVANLYFWLSESFWLYSKLLFLFEID